MKIVAGIVMFVLFGVFADAQDAKVVAEIAASPERAVKNSPFSAEAVSESVQTLADGNRIVRKSTSKMYRNSEGRFRREFTGGSGGVLGSVYTLGEGVTIMDPVGGFRYSIDPNLKTARQFIYKPHNEIKIITGTGVGTTVEGVVAAPRPEARVGVVSDKVREEIRAAVAAAPAIAARTITGEALAGGVGMGTTYSVSTNSKWETRTENLGVQNIEGVDAEGTRTITTIPADAIGNERPIEITYEKWYSRELQLVVMSKHNDPRFGEQTYRLTNIVRAEPDPSLFTPPQGYRLITEPGKAHKYSTIVNAVQAEKAAKAAAAKATPVANTKP